MGELFAGPARSFGWCFGLVLAYAASSWGLSALAQPPGPLGVRAASSLGGQRYDRFASEQAGRFAPAGSASQYGALNHEAPPNYPATGRDAGYSVASDSWSLDPAHAPDGASEPWHFELFPDDLIYTSYLAAAKESRFRSVWTYEQDAGWIWDITLGGRVPVFRHGRRGVFSPEGWQLDLEGAAFPRLNMEDEMDLISADFRFGIPLTYGRGPWRTKFAYYHLSSHVGDEFLAKNPGFQRVNFSRDVLVWGVSYYLNPDLRVYGEVGWAFYSDVSEPWEFLFGVEYSPNVPTGLRGAPFWAFNGHLREEVGFGGNVVVQAGWQWRDHRGGPLIRVGGEYFNGMSEQFAFFNTHEQKLGLGLWYDY